LGILLLTHLKRIFGDEEKLSTDIILQKLRAIEESPWNDIKGKPLDDRGLARRLAQYCIKPRRIRVGSDVLRGYQRQDCLDAWSRYVPPSPATSGTTATSATSKPNQGDRVADTVADVALPVADQRQKAINKNNAVANVAPVALPVGGRPDAWDTVGPVPKFLDRNRGATNGGSKPPCAQCGDDDGQQERHQHDNPEIWLHRECVRFWNGSQ
jgi:hypothetical protein